MPQEPIKKRLNRLAENVRMDIRQLHGDEARVHVIRDQQCPFHISAELPYMSLMIRCCLDRVAQEEREACRQYGVRRDGHTVYQLAVRRANSHKYKTIVLVP